MFTMTKLCVFLGVLALAVPAAAQCPGDPTSGNSTTRALILSLGATIPATAPDAMQRMAVALQGQGYADAVMEVGSGPSDHKAWINGEAWTWRSSDPVRCPTITWSPYLQVAYDGSGFSACGIPNSAHLSCPSWFVPLAPKITRMALAADFNGDGQSDLISQTSDGKVSLALNSGGTFTEIVSPYNGVVSAWNIVGTGDFNGDGRTDLLWQGPTGAIVVWLNNGASAPTVLTVYGGVSVWRIVGVADLDHNGSPDFIWQSPTGQVVVWLMDGLNLLSAQYIWNAPSIWRVVGAGDFNGDGDADLLWQGTTGTLVAWMMHGITLASAPTIYGGTTPWLAVSVGDVNGDGKPDIVWRGPTGQMVVWLMNGSALTQAKYLRALTTGWQLSDTP
jgi:hypothetical protein